MSDLDMRQLREGDLIEPPKHDDWNKITAIRGKRCIPGLLNKDPTETTSA